MLDLVSRGPVKWMGVTYRIALASSGSQGKIGLFESLTPARSGPPRHVHQNEDEAFYVQSGELKFWIDGQTKLCGPGDTAFAPRQVEHAFRVIGDQPARMLTVLTPGGMETFFSDMAAGSYQIPEDMTKVCEIAAKYGLTFTGPPLED